MFRQSQSNRCQQELNPAACNDKDLTPCPWCLTKTQAARGRVSLIYRRIPELKHARLFFSKWRVTFSRQTLTSFAGLWVTFLDLRLSQLAIFPVSIRNLDTSPRRVWPYKFFCPFLMRASAWLIWTWCWWPPVSNTSVAIRKRRSERQVQFLDFAATRTAR